MEEEKQEVTTNCRRFDWGDITEEIAIAILGIIAVSALFIMKGNEIPLAIGSGLIGYLKGMKKVNGN
jgi:hypothetical protein